MDKSDYSLQPTHANQSPHSLGVSKSFSHMAYSPTSPTSPTPISDESPRIHLSAAAGFSSSSTSDQQQQQQSQQQEPTSPTSPKIAVTSSSSTKKDTYLAAPPSKTRRVRSTSPSNFNNPKAMVKSKSNMDQARKEGSSGGAHNLLSPNQPNSKASTKSIESTNSTTFSGGFLPSPDVQTPSNQSSMIGFNHQALMAKASGGDGERSAGGGGGGGGSSTSFCAMALATATIGTSILLTQEQQELLRQQITHLRRPSYTERPSFKGNFLSAFAHAAAKKLTTSSSLMPVIFLIIFI